MMRKSASNQGDFIDIENQKSFLLGVGCQKGGTTWLNLYLSSHPQCDLGFTKEYHVFDALYLPGFQRWISRKLDLLNQATYGRARNPLDIMSSLQSDVLKHLSFYQDVSNYFDYFAQLHNSQKGVRIVGDITPSYSMLSPDIFRSIKAHLLEHRFRIRVLFVMRDPVDRLISHLAMQKYRLEPGSRKFSEDDTQDLLRYSTHWQFALRSRYERTVRVLDSVFDPADIHYCFYETLMNKSSIQSLCAFLGIDYVPPNFRRRVNARPQSLQVEAEAIAKVQSKFQQTYSFIAGRFPEFPLETEWRKTSATS